MAVGCRLSFGTGSFIRLWLLKGEWLDLKHVERILIKIAIAQFIFLLLAQIFLHQVGALPELIGVTKYEGTGQMNHSDMLEVFQGR